MDDGFRVGLEDLDVELCDVELCDVELEVRGTLPPWLRGTVVRNGPGRWSAQPGRRGQQARHWFGGLAMLQRFRVRDGRVTYAHRNVHSPAWRAASETGAFAYAEVGTVPSLEVARAELPHAAPPGFDGQWYAD